MTKFSTIQKTPFAGATETVVAQLGEEEALTFEVAVAGVTTLFLLQDRIESATEGAQDTAAAVEGLRGAIVGTLRDVVRSWNLTDDDENPIDIDEEGLAVFDTVSLYKLLTVIAEAISGAPFVTEQLTRSKSGPNRATRRKKK